MEFGELAMNGSRLYLASAVWEPQEPSFHSHRVLDPGPLGLHTRPAWRCSSCTTLVLLPPPPDPGTLPYTGRSLVRGNAPAVEVEKRDDVAPGPVTWEAFGERTDDDPLKP